MSTRAQAIALPAPVGGLNFRDPLPRMDPIYSPWIVNADCEAQSIKTRPGVVRHCIVDSGASAILGLGAWSIHYLFAYVQDGSSTNKVYNVTSATQSLALTLADNDADEAYPVKFAKRLAFITETDVADCNGIYDGSAWAAWGFTGGPSAAGRVGIGYKGRFYIFAGTTMYWGGLEEVLGPLSSQDLQYVFDEGGSIDWAAVVSSPGQRAAETFLAFGTTAGEILVYGGNYPDDATWGLVGQYKTSGPLYGTNTIIPYQNDTWLLTRTGVVSLLDLIASGQKAIEENSVSHLINPYWADLLRRSGNTFQSGRGRNYSGAYWPERNRILILVPGHYDVPSDTYSNSQATVFSYNCVTRAWSLYRLENVDPTVIGGLTYFNGSVYFFSGSTVMKFDASTFGDEPDDTGDAVAYDFAIHGAHSAFGSESSKKRVQGYKPILKTDFAGSLFGIKTATDFGASVSTRQDNPDQQSGFNIQEYAAVGNGYYEQYRLEGTTDTESALGLELFSVNTILSPEGLR